MPRRSRQLILLTAFLLTTVSLADDTTGPVKPQNAGEKAPNATNGPPAPVTLSPEWPFDIRYLMGEDGQPVVVPDKVHLRGYLNWLARENAKQQAPLAYSVTSIACTGTAADELLYLTVVAKIQTTTDDWVLVPLQMSEATLREIPVYKGTGVPPLQVPYDSERGYAWWFKGNKDKNEEHVLTLSVAVPIRKQTPMRRVQLSLPPTAVSSVKLRVPHSRVSDARASDDRSKVSVKNVEGTAEIDVIGLGPRMDVSWQVAPDLSAVDTTLEVVTSITATLAEAERTATLFATQTIRSVGQQGTFDQVSVKLPAGGELLQVDSSEYRDYEIDPSDATRVVVKLQRKIAGPFDLRWTVRVPLPAAGEGFVIDGFDVDRARIQSGFLAVAIVGDFRLSQVVDKESEGFRDRSVQQINPDALPAALRQARTSVAYRFENRLSLRLSLRRVDPFVSASPEVWMQIDQEMVRFGATYEFHVLRGSISEASFRWPGWKEGGWIVDKIEAENLGPQLQEDAPDSDEMKIEFTEPAQKRFKLTIWARRMLEEGALVAAFALPVAKTSTPSVARLAVIRPQNLELDLQPVVGTVLRPQADVTTRVVIPRELQKLHRDEYRIESREASFRAAMTVHPREVTVATTVAASQERPGMTVVRQRVTYNVAYGSLSEVQFVIPPGLKPGQMLVSEADGNELTNRSADESTDREISVLLDPPRSGRFELDLQYSTDAVVKERPDGAQVLSVPLVVSKDAEFSSTQFQWRDAQGRDAKVRGDEWSRFSDPNGQWAWMLPRAAAEVEVALLQSAGAWGGATITRALVRSTIGADGTIQTVAEYRFSGAVLDLSVGFPANVQLVSASWDGRELKRGTPQIDEKGEGRYRFAPYRNAGATALLTIVTLTPGATLARFSSLSELTAPRLPENLPILQCRWQVTLPFGRHLFTEPEGFAPEFQWKRSGWFWSRHSDRTIEELEDWIGTVDSSLVSAPSTEGNTYLFSRAGAAEVLRFRMMSLSGIVLVGAGLALCLGWLFVKWPATRHVLTLLICGLAVSLAAVSFSETVLVLLQPAVLGLLLAAVAAGIDGYGKRRLRPVAVAMNSTSGYMTPASSISRGAVPGVGSNEHTSVRMPEVELLSESNESASQLSETGSRL